MSGGSTSVDKLGLAVRTSAVLRLAGLATFDDVAQLTAAELLALPNFTPACLEDLCAAAAARVRRDGVAPGFLPRDEHVRRLQRTALWLAQECERIGSEWARTQAELDLVCAQLEGLGVGRPA